MKPAVDRGLRRRALIYLALIGAGVPLIKGVHDLLTLYNAPRQWIALTVVAGVIGELGLVGKGLREQLDGVRPDNVVIRILDTIRALASGERPSDLHEERAREFVLQAVLKECAPDPLAYSQTPHLALGLSYRASTNPSSPHGFNGSIQDAYVKAGEQLVVLGPPGGGKTTVMQELCRVLAVRAGANSRLRIPILLDLAKWRSESKSFTQWVVSEIHSRPYGAAIDIARFWVEKEEDVILFLDGLDEVPINSRAQCVEAINAFHAEHGQTPLVVSCRTAEYDALPAHLDIKSAVELQPLTTSQVDTYLAQLGPNVAALRSAVSSDPELAELMSNPLVLFVASKTHAARPQAPAGDLTPEQRREQVLSDFVQQQIADWPSAQPKNALFKWLGYLARYLGGGPSVGGAESRSEAPRTFHLDLLQPDVLPTGAQRAAFRMTVALIWASLCAAIAVVTVLAADVLSQALLAFRLPPLPPLQIQADSAFDIYIRLPDDLPRALIMAAAVAVVIGLWVGWTGSDEISTTQPISFARIRMVPQYVLVGGVVSAATFGIGIGTLGAVFQAWINPEITGIMSVDNPSVTVIVTVVIDGVAFAVAFAVLFNRIGLGLSLAPAWWGLMIGAGFAILDLKPGVGPWLYAVGLGWFTGAVGGLVLAMQPAPYEEPAAPGEAMRIAKRNATIAAVLGFLGGVLVVAPGIWIIQFAKSDASANNIYTAAFLSIFAGLISGVSASTIVGGGSFICHRVLLEALSRQGLAPHDYLAFLEDGARAVILRRRGGGYQFMHRLIQDRFADPEAAASSA